MKRILQPIQKHNCLLDIISISQDKTVFVVILLNHVISKTMEPLNQHEKLMMVNKYYNLMDRFINLHLFNSQFIYCRHHHFYLHFDVLTKF